MDSSEKIIFTNSFGTVSDKRVIINYKNGTEDISLWQISSVSFVRKRNMLLSLLYFFIGIVLLKLIFGSSETHVFVMIIALIFFLFFILVGIAYFIGNHQIRLEVLGAAIKPVKVEIAKTKEGRAFSEAIKKQVISS